ncbi:MAG: cardiolipin synthase [Steroidobacteraceae bacterium]
MVSQHLEAAALISLHVAVVAGVGLRVVLGRHAPGSSVAWILLTALLPIAGVVAYALIGERPIGKRRADFARTFFSRLPASVNGLTREERADPDTLPPPWDGLARLACRSTGMPLMARSSFGLIDGAERILRSIIEDVERSTRSVEMEFYIWNAGGTADEVADALARAAARGVRVRVLLDALGSKEFLKTDGPSRMRAAGIELEVALGVTPWRIPFRRIDLRLHRKIVVVDGHIAYTGSMNLVDPRCFKQDAGVGEWVDAMTRAEGPIVGALHAVFAFDWGMQTGESPALGSDVDRAAWAAAGGRQVAQVVMSGPGSDDTANLRLITQAISSARRTVVLTTPYFVADTSLALALENAAMRGCEVTLIVPDRNDSWLVEYASRWFFEDLNDAGVRIRRYKGGLLHTKSVTVDGEVSLFGTANLDIRSLSLNFELMLAIYDAPFTATLLALQRGYEAGSEPVAPEQWRRRPLRERMKEGFAYLAAPLL